MDYVKLRKKVNPMFSWFFTKQFGGRLKNPYPSCDQPGPSPVNCIKNRNFLFEKIAIYEKESTHKLPGIVSNTLVICTGKRLQDIV
jgi:hypothetical protein